MFWKICRARIQNWKQSDRLHLYFHINRQLSYKHNPRQNIINVVTNLKRMIQNRHTSKFTKNISLTKEFLKIRKT